LTSEIFNYKIILIKYKEGRIEMLIVISVILGLIILDKIVGIHNKNNNKDAIYEAVEEELKIIK
jgi:NADH:ubiquinone oxidoreductase subunit 3 (subunit A)